MIQAPEVLSAEIIDLVLDEAERALIDVEARADEPDQRSADLPEAEAPGIGELRLAIAELTDAFPGLQLELEAVGERLRTVGATAASQELEGRPHILDLVRLSLEVFFRSYPNLDVYEADFGPLGEDDEDVACAAESYDAYRQLVELLRKRLS